MRDGLTDNSIATEYSKIIGRPATFDEFAAAARASKKHRPRIW